jgi:hypothetical protein
VQRGCVGRTCTGTLARCPCWGGWGWGGVVAAGCLLRRRRCRRLLTPAERLVLVAIAELVHQDDYRRGSPQTSRTHDELVRVAGLTNAALRKAIYRPANPVVEHADRPPLEVRVPDTAVLLAMGRDQADGRITLRGRNHRLSVTWDTTRNDALYAEEQAFSGELVRRFGGRPFVTPTWRLLRQPVTVHNLGGAPMGTDPATAVVDIDRQVFGHPGLYVIDGAILPGATGGNPSLTIAAVAERCIESAVRRITGVHDWAAPQHADVVPREVPEDIAVQAVVARGPRFSAAPGIPIREVMRGSASLPEQQNQNGQITLRRQGLIPDLEAFLGDLSTPSTSQARSTSKA